MLRFATAILGFALYVWYAAVRFVPRVKRRKRVRRAAYSTFTFSKRRPG
jgi:hypothetical protein